MSRADWFEQLVGFRETDGATVRENLWVQDGVMTSRVNGARLACGSLELASLAELRHRAHPRLARLRGPLCLSEVLADVRDLHGNPDHAGAVFQVASLFNLLEAASPELTPERGVSSYASDPTQGPACAAAAGAGTIYRQWFVPVDGGRGQTRSRQLDTLADLGRALGNHDGALWTMRNGYALASEAGLSAIAARLAAADDAQRDALRGLLRVGVQRGVEVTLPGAGQRVTQVYAAALPVARGGPPAEAWEPFARLVLEAAYEATLLAAVLAERPPGRVFLTLLGAGACGNPLDWVLDALARALERVARSALDVRIVSPGSSRPEVARLARDFGGRRV